MESERTGPVLMDDGAPEFPPLLTGHAVLAGQSAFETAIAAAKDGSAGAGDLFWGVDNRFLDCSIILEPEVAALKARQMHFLLMVAFGDSFGALAPAELGVYYRWPSGFFVNSGEVGHARIAMPEASEDQVPDWLVVGLNIEMAPDAYDLEPGETPDRTTLAEEGCGDLSQTLLLESLSRHFLTWLHYWEEDGFKSVHEVWTGRARELKIDRPYSWAGDSYNGEFLGLDEEGNLLLKSDNGTQQLDFAAAIERF